MEGIDYQGGSSYTRGINKGILRNNISFNGSVRNCDGSGIDASHNSWDLQGIRISEDDFVSIDTAGVFGPRKEDGSLPDVDFMKLAKNSQLIDKGEDVGLPFFGDAPDLGAFEYHEPSSIAVPSQKTPQSVRVFPGVFNSNEFILFELSGRRIPHGTINQSYRILIHDKKTAAGAHHTSTILYIR
jgi:hypothetical protein